MTATAYSIHSSSPSIPLSSSSIEDPRSNKSKRRSSKYREREHEDDKERRAKRRGLAARAAAPLFAVFCERLGFYLVSGTLQSIFLSSFEFSDCIGVIALIGLITFSNYFMCSFPGMLGDSIVGRFTMVMICLLLSMVANFCLIASAFRPLSKETSQNAWILPLMTILMIASPIATAVKPLLLVIGADQYNESCPHERQCATRYLHIVYWVQNLAALTSTYVGTWLTIPDLESSDLQDLSSSGINVFTFGLLMNFIAFMTMLVKSRQIYGYRREESSSLESIWKIFCKSPCESKHIFGYMFSTGIFAVIIGQLLAITLAIMGLRFIGTVSTFGMSSTLMDMEMSSVTLLIAGCIFILVASGKADPRKPAYAWIYKLAKLQPEKYNTIGMARRLVMSRDVYRLVAWLACCTTGWGIILQTQSILVMMDCQMKPHLNAHTDLLMQASSICVIAFFPVKHYLLSPQLRYYFPRFFPMKAKIKGGFALIIVFIATVSIGIIEILRKKSAYIQVTCTQDLVDTFECTLEQIGELVPQQSKCYKYSDTGFNAPVREMTRNWLYIPVVILAVAEVALGPTQFEVLYFYAPPKLRATMQAMQFEAMGTGGFMIMCLATLIPTWTRRDGPIMLDDVGFDTTWFVIAFVHLIGTFAIFWIFSFDDSTDMRARTQDQDDEICALQQRVNQQIIENEMALPPVAPCPLIPGATTKWVDVPGGEPTLWVDEPDVTAHDIAERKNSTPSYHAFSAHSLSDKLYPESTYSSEARSNSQLLGSSSSYVSTACKGPASTHSSTHSN